MGLACWIPVFFFLVSTTHGCLFSEHLAKYVNNSIDVCDDFYDHVCSSVTTYEELFTAKAARKLQEKISPFMSKEVLTFINEHEKQLKKALLYNDLVGAHKMDAWFKYILTEEFQEIEKKFKRNFDAWKSLIISSFKEAPWTKRYPELHKRLKNAVLASHEQPNFNFTEKLLNLVESWNTCANSSESASHCFDKLTFELTIKRRLSSLQREVLPVFDQLNAGFSRIGSVVIMFPLLYTLDYENANYMMGSLLFIFGHELGHSFFFREGDNRMPDPAQPSNTDCFKRAMAESCVMFFGKDAKQCYNTEKGTTFGEDAPDWVGMKTITTVMKTLTHILPKYESEIWKQVFYAHAISKCKLKDDMGRKIYSVAKVRVNGIFRQFSDFARTFNCKYGDRMVKEEKCDPLTGPDAPHVSRLKSL